MRLIGYMSEGWRISANWRLQKTRYGTAQGGLRGSACPEGHLQFPPREPCPQCAQELLTDTPIELSPVIEQFLASLVNSWQDS